MDNAGKHARRTNEMPIDYNTLLSIIAALIAFASTVAAYISAATARQSHRQLTKAERERRVRELSLLANKVDATATDVGELGQQIVPVIDAAFSLANRTGSGYPDVYKSEIAYGEKEVILLQEEARKLLKDGLSNLSDKLVDEHLLKLDGDLVRIQRIRRKFEDNLALFEAERRRLVG